MNDIQKAIISAINNGDVNNIKSFIDKFVKTERRSSNEKYAGPGLYNYEFSIDLSKGVNAIIDSEATVKIAQFLTLWRYLLNSGLIIDLDAGKEEARNNLYSLFYIENNELRHHNRLFHMSSQFLVKEIHPLMALEDFIANG